MRIHSPNSIMTMMICALLHSACSEAADIYTMAGVVGTWNPGTPPPNDGGGFGDYWREGTTSASASASLGYASGHASVNLINNPGFRFSAYAGSNSAHSSSDVSMKAQWIDIIRLDGMTSIPEKIRVNMHVDSYVDLSYIDSLAISSAIARFGLSEISTSSGLGLIGLAPSTSFSFQSEVWLGVQKFPYSNFFSSSNTSNLIAENLVGSMTSYTSRITWDVAFELAYHPDAEGYYLNLVGGVQGVGYQGGSSHVNLMNTIRLTDVTMTDGSQIPGSISFDSGFEIATVPEPSSTGLAVLSALVIIGLRKFRTRPDLTSSRTK